MAHVAGQSRYQVELIAPALDDLVRSDHPVRVIDAFVETLDLRALGFARVDAEATGRPPYAPGDLLKLYIYGYMNQMRSSRRLEREAGRNLEVMWLIDRVQPSFKTIADFRKDHADAIVETCRAFVVFCRRQSLMAGETVAIDGTKIAAVASRKQVFTPQRIAKMNEAIERKIAEHLAAMDEADGQEPAAPIAAPNVAAAVAALKAQQAKLQERAQERAQELAASLPVSLCIGV
jgi:transposase